MKALARAAELALMLLILWGTLEVLKALQPGPWLVPEYGTWVAP
jgi:hypothetical protein